MEHGPVSLPGLARRWQAGWGICRGVGPATEARGGLHIDSERPGGSRQILVLDADGDPGSLRGLAAEISGAASPAWLTVPTRRPVEMEAILARAGLVVLGAPEALMHVRLSVVPSQEPSVLAMVSTTVADSVIDTEIRVPSGELAARGTMAVVGRDAIAHNIQTFPPHRRRGLGSAVMFALVERATEMGASSGLLVASSDGQELYAKLGWTVAAIVLTAASATQEPTSRSPSGQAVPVISASRRRR